MMLILMALGFTVGVFVTQAMIRVDVGREAWCKTYENSSYCE